MNALEKLVKEYRPSMDAEVLHSWAAEVVSTLHGQQSEAVAIKPLEWVTRPIFGGDNRLMTKDGRYWLSRVGESGFMVIGSDDEDRVQRLGPEIYGTEEAAKEATQADHERRTRAYLAPTEAAPVAVSVNAEFHFDFDPCPFPLPEDFDGLTCEWGQSNYVNPPFGTIMHEGKKKGPTAWVRKAILEQQKGKRVVLVYPVDKWVLMILSAIGDQSAQPRRCSMDGNRRRLARQGHRSSHCMFHSGAISMTNTPTLPTSKEAEAFDSDGTLLQVATEEELREFEAALVAPATTATGVSEAMVEARERLAARLRSVADHLALTGGIETPKPDGR